MMSINRASPKKSYSIEHTDHYAVLQQAIQSVNTLLSKGRKSSIPSIIEKCSHVITALSNQGSIDQGVLSYQKVMDPDTEETCMISAVMCQMTPDSGNNVNRGRYWQPTLYAFELGNHGAFLMKRKLPIMFRKTHLRTRLAERLGIIDVHFFRDNFMRLMGFSLLYNQALQRINKEKQAAGCRSYLCVPDEEGGYFGAIEVASNPDFLYAIESLQTMGGGSDHRNNDNFIPQYRLLIKTFYNRVMVDTSQSKRDIHLQFEYLLDCIGQNKVKTVLAEIIRTYAFGINSNETSLGFRQSQEQVIQVIANVMRSSSWHKEDKKFCGKQKSGRIIYLRRQKDKGSGEKKYHLPQPV